MAEKQGSTCRKNKIVHIVEPLVCFVAMILQIVGFSTNAWAVMKERNTENGRLTKLGLWSTTICYELDCTTKTHMDEHKENIAKGFTYKEPQYAFQVGNEVNTTLALVCVIVCFCLSILNIFCRAGKRQIQFGMVLMSLISGILLFTVVGYFTAELMAIMRVELNKVKYEYYFPWSLLISASGAVIITINGIVLTVCACRNRSSNILYKTVTIKETIAIAVPPKCTDDFPPDYNELEPEDDSEQRMV